MTQQDDRTDRPDGSPVHPSDPATLADVGVVVIGRNEGDRLGRCLDSLLGAVDRIVYVDSRSTDGSPETARARGVETLVLDESRPFTAARGRNTGFSHLTERHPDLRYIQFVDGDTEADPAWLGRARADLEAHPETAAVCGRLRERHPDASIYNLLCDIEWDGPLGEIKACGGNAMYRVEAFAGVDGFREEVIAGEEPELCFRLRRAGWTIRRIDEEMMLHDAAIHRFSHWWKRTERSGYAYSFGAWMHGDSPERYNVHESRRIWFWGLGLPAAAVLGAAPTFGVSLWLLAGYPVSAYRAVRGRGRTVKEAATFATFNAVGKLPSLQGAIRFHRERLAGVRPEIIDYKAS